MGKFLTPLQVEKMSEREWKLTAPLVYDSDTVGVIVVPTGFVTNFGSVPRLPFMYLLFGGVGDEACTVHDWLYSRRLLVGRDLHRQVLERKTADKIMRGVIYECLRVDDASVSGLFKNLISLGTAWAMWLGVRIGGASHWRE